jgi:IS30 family transposase
MAGVKGTKHLTEEEFNNIKSLKNAGISNSMIAKVIKRSNHIINEIGKIETFDEFREFQRARREEYRTRKEAEIILKYSLCLVHLYFFKSLKLLIYPKKIEYQKLIRILRNY